MLRRIWNYASNNALIAGLLTLLIAGIVTTLWLSLKDSTSTWFWSAANVSHGGLTLLVLLLLTALAVIIGLWKALRRESTRLQAANTPQDVVQLPLLPTAQEAAPAPAAPVAKFNPESFALTPTRCRALLILRTRISSITTLYELHQLVTDDGVHVPDRRTTQGHVQEDMEAAESAGLVRIERVSDYTYHYQLAIPDGRNWINANEARLQACASRGLTKRDPRSPYLRRPRG